MSRTVEEIMAAEDRAAKRKLTTIIVVLVCAAVLAVGALLLIRHNDKILHIGWAGGDYPGSSDYSELCDIVESVIDKLGYSENYIGVEIDEVYLNDNLHSYLGAPDYNLLILPAGSKDSYGDVQRVTVIADISLQNIGLENLCIVLIDWGIDGKMDKAEVERLTAIGERLNLTVIGEALK